MMSQRFGMPLTDESAALSHVSFRHFLFLEFINYCNPNPQEEFNYFSILNESMFAGGAA